LVVGALLCFHIKVLNFAFLIDALASLLYGMRFPDKGTSQAARAFGVLLSLIGLIALPPTLSALLG